MVLLLVLLLVRTVVTVALRLLSVSLNRLGLSPLDCCLKVVRWNVVISPLSCLTCLLPCRPCVLEVTSSVPRVVTLLGRLVGVSTNVAH